ncbi:MAG: formate--tetrahydrofolate ligase [Clostridia bacterium]|nr:formate--tetrahydrofolate ligase [Clostridia bacterium]
MLTDIEIAQRATLFPIAEIAAAAGIPADAVEPYGKYKAKIDPKYIEGNDGKLILVTAITPTPAGEGKTTTTIGLADALTRLGKRAVAALRDPSLGPVFGIKGGAAGGGYSQVVPMDDINLHFTGDFHAIGAANNLLAAMIDNHIHQGNELGFALDRIVWKRCVDMNDRALRKVTVGLGGKANGIPRDDGYDITVASEVMAILCLASDLTDLKERLGRIIAGYTEDDRPITAKDLKAHGAMAALLKDAIRPNLVQTLEHTPVLIHGGPFANIAHGCNSVIATKLALKLGDYVVTEAGFGADLGAQKFLDIKCRMANLRPSAAVLVATVRALKYHGGVEKDSLTAENIPALIAGFPNLLRHADNLRAVYGLPCVVAINRFPSDTDAELNVLHELCAAHDLDVTISEVWEKGGEGGVALAERVIGLCERPNRFRFCCSPHSTPEEKLNTIARRIYHAEGVVFTEAAHTELNRLKTLGFGELPVCVAKTQYSFSDDPKKRGVPSGFRITVRRLRVAAGAGFIIALTGSIMTMPGLPKHPAAERIDVDENGNISGLF